MKDQLPDNKDYFDEEWRAGFRSPFYLKPSFYVPFILTVICILSFFLIVGPLKIKDIPATPYYDEAVLVFPPNTTEWRLSAETRSSRPKYLCLIDGKWHQCYPTFMEPTPAK